MTALGWTWLLVLIVASVLYFGVAVFVTIAGARDLKELFSGGTEETPEEQPPEQNTESAPT